MVRTTRRQWRKSRLVLRVGDTNLRGKVVKWFPEKNFGFIQPECHAARIYFHYADIPRHRVKCAVVGRLVFFAVEQGNKGKLKACIL